MERFASYLRRRPDTATTKDVPQFQLAQSEAVEGCSMGRVLNGSTTTIEAVRTAIQHSQERLMALTKRYGIAAFLQNQIFDIGRHLFRLRCSARQKLVARLKFMVARALERGGGHWQTGEGRGTFTNRRWTAAQESHGFVGSKSKEGLIAIFASLLLAHRRRLGLSQSALAHRAGLSVPTIHQLENGGGQINSLDKAIAAMGLVYGFADTAADFPGLALAQLRRAKALSQRAMAARIGVSQQTIVTLETKFCGSVALLAQFLNAVKVSQPLRDPLAPKRRLVPKQNDVRRDIVMTPHVLARRIMALFEPQMFGVVLEPARGHGAFYDAVPAHLEKDWCEIAMGRDFFGYRRRVDWIVTNPPFSILRPFLMHAMEIADNVVFVCPLAHFSTKARLRAIAEAQFGFCRIVTVPQPAGWPSSGFQLAAVHIRRGWRGDCAMEQLRPISIDAYGDVDSVEFEAELLAAE